MSILGCPPIDIKLKTKHDSTCESSLAPDSIGSDRTCSARIGSDRIACNSNENNPKHPDNSVISFMTSNRIDTYCHDDRKVSDPCSFVTVYSYLSIGKWHVDRFAVVVDIVSAKGASIAG